MARQRLASEEYVFLTKEARTNLPKFAYKGQDRSLLYIYILSPLASFLVNHWTPSSVAPNTITMLGLCFMILSYAAMWYYAPSLVASEEEPVPKWVFFYHCAAMLIYQTLDNMDGKQARKTKSSSPLGLLFDHGCDAINSIFGSVGWILGLGLDPSKDPLMCYALILGPYAMFYIATWEEYYTGELILPFINGPNEGIAGGALLSLVTGLYGLEVWHSTHLYDTYIAPWIKSTMFASTIPPLRNADLQVGLAVVGMIREVIYKSSYVVRRHGIQTMSTQLPLWILFFATLVADPQLWLRMPRTSVNLSSALFVEVVTQMMLDHITDQTYSPLGGRWVLWPLGILVLMKPGQLTDTTLLVYTTLVWAYILYKAKRVVHEICCLLKLQCFDITSSKRTATKST